MIHLIYLNLEYVGTTQCINTTKLFDFKCEWIDTNGNADHILIAADSIKEAYNTLVLRHKNIAWLMPVEFKSITTFTWFKYGNGDNNLIHSKEFWTDLIQIAQKQLTRIKIEEEEE